MSKTKKGWSENINIWQSYYNFCTPKLMHFVEFLHKNLQSW